MDAGAAALVLGLVAVGTAFALPMAWRRAAGGLLVLLTLAVTALQLLGVL